MKTEHIWLLVVIVAAIIAAGVIKAKLFPSSYEEFEAAGV